MDKATLKKRCEDTLAAIEAHERGEPIQKMLHVDGGWYDLPDTCGLMPNNWCHWYRPKPKEPRIAWIEIDENGNAGMVWLDHEPYEESGLTKFIEVIDES